MSGAARGWPATASALAALERGVPSPLLQALRASGTGPESFTRFSVLDHHGRTCLRLPVSPEEQMLMIGRRPLRAVLARELGEQVRWGVRFTGYSEHAERVVVHLDGARDEEVDVLVGADGTRSRITRQLKGQEASRPSGIVGIAGKTPLTDVTSPSVPEALFHGPGFAIGPRGVGMFLSTHQPRPAEAQVRAELEPAYVVWSVAARLDQFSGPPEGLASRALIAEAHRLLERWSPRFHPLLEASEPESPAAFPFVFPATLGPWSSERVTLLCDAITPCPPRRERGRAPPSSTRCIWRRSWRARLAPRPWPATRPGCSATRPPWWTRPGRPWRGSAASPIPSCVSSPPPWPCPW
ncbi:FAD-dependent monooxygenase [Melittangium boletus]|uniref:FAD-dependent monooxygenase n=1 Tax=Melittangium boletus TaxID=83453 RepID=UPI003DA1D85E